MKATKEAVKDLWIVLAVELLTIPLAISYFRFIEPKKLAAIFAASTFILTGLFILLKSRKWHDGYASFTYWLIHIQLFLLSIPMLIGRIAFWERDFSEIKFLFYSGPEFHTISERIYMLLIVGTIIDLTVHTIKFKRNSSKDR